MAFAEITLTRAEQRLAAYLAKARYQSNRASGVRDQLRSTRDPVKMEAEATGAELAFCCSMNLYPDLSVSPRKGGYDCRTAKGHRMDVKWVARPTDHLLAVLGKRQEREVDAFVLVRGHSPVYDIVGWVPFRQLIHRSKIRNFGYGATYAMASRDLYPMETLGCWDGDQEFGWPRHPVIGTTLDD